MTKPQLIIPMSGLGKRFQAAGFAVPKPLIEVFGRPIIAHVLDMYPGWTDVLFIVNENHLNDKELRLEETLYKYIPTAKIHPIQSHNLGPSFAVWQARELVHREKPVVVNYCDFAGTFNLHTLEHQLLAFDALVLTYTGFHPHMIRSTKFAYIKKNSAGFISDIQEKQPYTNDPNSEEASAGAYGFRNGKLLLQAIARQMSLEMSLAGEFYTSLTIKAALELGQTASSLLMEQFCQWGTPADLSDFNYWTQSLSHLNDSKDESLLKSESIGIILAGGRGARIANHTQAPKPAIQVGQKQLWELAARSLNSIEKPLLVIRDEVLPYIKDVSTAHSLILQNVTKGQAETALIGIQSLIKTDEIPITILASDNVLPDGFEVKVLDFVKEFDLDIAVWTSMDYPPSIVDPEQFSWVQTESRFVKNATYKRKPKDFPKNWEVITGNFTFKDYATAESLIEFLILNQELKINNEFYLDSTISLGLEKGMRIGAIQVPWYFSLGTPSELKVYEYWSHFLKVKSLNE